MHLLYITIGDELGYSVTVEDLGRARKLRGRIVKNGYEYENEGMFTFYPPHRIRRVDIKEMSAVKMVHPEEEKDEDEKDE